MIVSLVIIGFLIGAVVLDGLVGGIVTGGILGFLAAFIVKHNERLEFLRSRLMSLQEHVDRLEGRLERLSPAEERTKAQKT